MEHTKAAAAANAHPSPADDRWPVDSRGMMPSPVQNLHCTMHCTRSNRSKQSSRIICLASPSDACVQVPYSNEVPAAVPVAIKSKIVASDNFEPRLLSCHHCMHAVSQGICAS